MANGANYEIPDNYIYFYHTDTVLLIPEFADSVSDHIEVTYSSTNILTRTAPIYSFSYAGPRTCQFAFQLHRDLMADLNANNNMKRNKEGEDEVDVFIREIQAAALPSYESASKMVNPPIVAVRMGTDIFIKGIVQGGIGVTYKYPIIPGRNQNNKADNSKQRYSNVDITFNIIEIDPYDADSVRQFGSFRGLSTTLERKAFDTLTKQTTVSTGNLDDATR